MRSGGTEAFRPPNIVVIADEAHHSQYDFIDGFARHMRDALPHTSFIGFTSAPIELTDKNTRAVFGDYISVYDIQRAVQDKATVPIYYESRLAKLAHDVPEAVIRRRFGKSLVNFDRLFRPTATTWRLYDGSVLGGRPLIAHGTGEHMPVVLDEAKWLEIRRRIEEVA